MRRDTKKVKGSFYTEEKEWELYRAIVPLVEFGSDASKDLRKYVHNFLIENKELVETVREDVEKKIKDKEASRLKKQGNKK